MRATPEREMRRRTLIYKRILIFSKRQILADAIPRGEVCREAEAKPKSEPVGAAESSLDGLSAMLLVLVFLTTHGATLLRECRLHIRTQTIAHNASAINERPRLHVPKLHVIEGGWDSRR